jgi:hypothetical protein
VSNIAHEFVGADNGEVAITSADKPHMFVDIGGGQLRQIDIHAARKPSKDGLA